jgi:transposase
MDLSRAVYSRDLKIMTMRALDAGSPVSEIALKYQLSPKLLERWRSEWRARGEAAFPGSGRRGASLPALDDARRIADLERKIGQLTMENDFLKQPCNISGIIVRAAPRASRHPVPPTRREHGTPLLPQFSEAKHVPSPAG